MYRQERDNLPSKKTTINLPGWMNHGADSAREQLSKFTSSYHHNDIPSTVANGGIYWRGHEALLGNGGDEGVGGGDRAGRRAARRRHEELGEQTGGDKRVSASVTATASMAWRLGRSGLSWG